MPPNYRQQQGAPLSRPERRGAWAVVAVTVACASGIGAWVSTNGFGRATPKHCVTVVVAGPTGGSYTGACGAKARPWCKTEPTAAGQLGPLATKACRKAGLLPPS